MSAFNFGSLIIARYQLAFICWLLKYVGFGLVLSKINKGDKRNPNHLKSVLLAVS